MSAHRTYPLPRSLALLFFLSFSANPVLSQSLQLRWEKEFHKEVSWYVRTSPGILLVQSVNTLTAIDGVTGLQLWQLPDLKSNSHTTTNLDIRERGRNLLEVPGMGELLLNRVKLPGDSDWLFIALNLMNGQRLWDLPPFDDLIAVLPLSSAREILLVSRHLDMPTYVAGLAVTTAVMTPALPGVLVSGGGVGYLWSGAPYPSHLIFQRVNPLTGATAWTTECPHIHNLQFLGDQLLLNKGNGPFSVLNLTSGKITREYTPAQYDLDNFLLPALADIPDHQVIYAGKQLDCVSLNSFQLRWQIHKLGKITNISQFGDLTLAMGSHHLVALEPKSGSERWRKKTSSPATELLWDKDSDTLLYADHVGLHSVNRSTGKVQMERHLEGEFVAHLSAAPALMWSSPSPPTRSTPTTSKPGKSSSLPANSPLSSVPMRSKIAGPFLTMVRICSPVSSTHRHRQRTSVARQDRFCRTLCCTAWKAIQPLKRTSSTPTKPNPKEISARFGGSIRKLHAKVNSNSRANDTTFASPCA
jgi:hypothetical protein